MDKLSFKQIDLSGEQIDLLEEKSSADAMIKYYSLKKEKAEAEINKYKNFDLVKRICKLLESDQENIDLIHSRKIALKCCLSYIKQEKKIDSDIDFLASSNKRVKKMIFKNEEN